MRPHSLTSYGDFATGAVHHPHDARDYGMHRIPGVAAAGAAGLPESCDLSPSIKVIYNQGSIPCCVLASIALMKSVEDQIDRKTWHLFDFLAAYHALGGDDRNGVPTRPALDYTQKTGLQIVGASVRHRIGSYAFAPQQDPAAWVLTLKAALAAGQPCVIACRLPELFGWDSGGAATEAYHQMGLLGYDPEGGGLGNWIIGNSWGNGWGKGGLGRLPIQFTLDNNFQGGDCYAYTAIDCLDPDLAPPGPAPAPAPAAPPNPLVVSGYLGTTISMPSAAEGSLLQIVGSGFDAGVIRATFFGTALPVIGMSARLLSVRLPLGSGGRAGAVTVRREGETVDGPVLYVAPSRSA